MFLSRLISALRISLLFTGAVLVSHATINAWMDADPIGKASPGRGYEFATLLALQSEMAS